MKGPQSSKAKLFIKTFPLQELEYIYHVYHVWL